MLKSIQLFQFVCLAVLLLATGAACDRAPARYNGFSKGAIGSGNDAMGNGGSADSPSTSSFTLADCNAPVKSTYRLTRTEIANSIAAHLKLSDAERDDLKGALSVDPSKTGFENDLSSLQLTADQILALSFSLDKILTTDKLKSVLACKDTASCDSALITLAARAYASVNAQDPDLLAYKNMLDSLKTKDDQRLIFAVKNIFLSMKFLFASTDKAGFRTHLANTLWLGSGEYSMTEGLAALDDKAFVKTLLSDVKSQRFAESFLMRRLKVDELTKGLDPLKSDRYSLLKSMGQETRLFIWDIFKSDRAVTDLITSKSTFVNKELAKLYGMPDPGEGFVKADLPDNRQGLITQGSILTATSKPTESNIISRGLFIVEKVLCQHIPAPPNVTAIPDQPAGSSKPLSPREQLEAHRAAPACASCHNLMDPPGFALENFGPLGAYRDKYENGLPIDSKAVFNDKTVTSTPNEFFAYVETKKEDFAECFSTELLTYVMRRSLTDEDKCAVDTLKKGFVEKNWGVETALNEILSWYKK